jgi:hypothetical protein
MGFRVAPSPYLALDKKRPGSKPKRWKLFYSLVIKVRLRAHITEPLWHFVRAAFNYSRRVRLRRWWCDQNQEFLGTKFTLWSHGLISNQTWSCGLKQVTSPNLPSRNLERFKLTNNLGSLQLQIIWRPNNCVIKLLLHNVVVIDKYTYLILQILTSI